ncbi:ABC transporter ATP-binding protein [Yinghuangia soli]|uniref:Fatty acid ABC transporter ATP-binding/permease protein n=1 Tax=Yinghuangia soli TaxID=2908204 RepID=A0AA41Q3H8_9ACTN|nr:ABC transporter ATP-binding protein [Yinghuangia soli]MCF2530854.1 ABC transporter ATP-binding protein/permease [Yinghuangia soli]
MAGPGRFMGGQPAEKSLDFKRSGARFLKLLEGDRLAVYAIIGLALLAVATSVIGPKILGEATDEIFTGAFGPNGVDFGAVGVILGWATAVYVASGVFSIIQSRLANRVLQRAVKRLRTQVEEKLSRLPLSYFDTQPRGEVLSRVTNDIDNVGQTLQQTMSQLLFSLLTIVGVLGMMFWISWLLALVALITVPISIFVAARIGKKAQPQFIQQWKTTGKLNAHIEEMYTGHALVKVFGRQDESAEIFRTENEKLYNASFKAQFVSGMMQPAMMFIGNLNYVVVAVIGGLRVSSGALSIGDVQAFVQYSRQFSQPLTQAASMANLVQSGVASAERVFELLDAPEQSPDPVVRARPDTLRGRVAFENVAFSYTPAKPLISDLSLTVRPGETVAIVGPTGAGKTTLVNLLMRFYEVTGGRITLDGVDTADMSRDELRSAVGMVLQDTWLFGGTIADNIAYGTSGATRDQICAAAKAAHADRFIRTLPDGYDTVVDDEGTGISAGEKQLITIARAFLAEPTILVLDEATSSVDTRTEVLIQRAMARLRDGRTAFVIAHRLSTIRDADTILVMEAGAIVEQGSHHQLLAAGGPYARLYESQFAEAPAEVD